MFDKPFFHKLNYIADWILRIVTINLILIVATLLVFTLYPSLYAAFKLFKDWRYGKNTLIFSGFWSYFKENLKKKFQISLIFILILLLGIYSMISYDSFIEENSGVIYLIGYYVVLLFLIMFVLITLYTIPVLIYFKEVDMTNLFKLSLYVMGKYFIITLLLSVLWIIPILLIFIPQFMVIYVIAGLSLTVLLWVLVSNPIFKFLERISVNVKTRN